MFGPLVSLGSNPNKINKYISKLFPNILSLMVKELVGESGSSYHVTAVCSPGGWLDLNEVIIELQ